MDAFSSYYIRKYKALEEQIKRLQAENKLLEELSAGTMSDRPEQTSGSAGTSVSTSTGRPPDPTEPEEPSDPPNPPFFPIDNTRGTSTKDIATLRKGIVF
jgi:hypothetical protein